MPEPIPTEAPEAAMGPSSVCPAGLGKKVSISCARRLVLSVDYTIIVDSRIFDVEKIAICRFLVDHSRTDSEISNSDCNRDV